MAPQILYEENHKKVQTEVRHVKYLFGDERPAKHAKIFGTIEATATASLIGALWSAMDGFTRYRISREPLGDGIRFALHDEEVREVVQRYASNPWLMLPPSEARCRPTDSGPPPFRSPDFVFEASYFAFVIQRWARKCSAGGLRAPRPPDALCFALAYIAFWGLTAPAVFLPFASFQPTSGNWGLCSRKLGAFADGQVLP